MAKVANIEPKEKVKDSFNKNEVIDFALSNMRERFPQKNFKKDELEKDMNNKIEEVLTRSPKTPAEMGRYLANYYGKVHPHFIFDRTRPLTTEEIKEHGLAGKTDREMIAATNKIRAQDRKRERAQWEKDRSKETALFRRYFMWYLESTRGPHKENKLGVKVMIGDDIEIEKGHYRKIY